MHANKTRGLVSCETKPRAICFVLSKETGRRVLQQSAISRRAQLQHRNGCVCFLHALKNTRLCHNFGNALSMATTDLLSPFRDSHLKDPF